MQSNALNIASVRRVKQNNNYSLITQSLAVEACCFVQTGCDVTGIVQLPHFRSNKGANNFCFLLLSFLVFIFFPVLPYPCPPFVLSFPSPSHRNDLGLLLYTVFLLSPHRARQLIAQKTCIRRDISWQLRCSGQ